MLDDIEQDDDVHLTDLPQAALIDHALQHVQSRTTAVLGGFGGKLDSRHLEMALGLLQEEAVGTPQLQQLAIGPVLANELQAMSEFAPQHRLGAEVIRIAIGTAAREIVCREVGACVGARRPGPPNAAAEALQ